MQKYGQTQFEAVQIYKDSERVIHDISKTNDEMIGREGRIFGVTKSFE